MHSAFLQPNKQHACCHHLAIAYQDGAMLLTALENILLTAFDTDEAAVIIAGQPVIDTLLYRLQCAGRDVGELKSSAQLICVDADQLLPQLMRDGQPDRAAFDAIVGGLIERAMSKHAGLVAFCELVNLLWKQGNFTAANELELWWNALIEKYHFSLICGYRADVLADETQSGFEQVCQTHTHFDVFLNHERLEHAMDLALREVVINANVAALRNALAQSGARNARMTPSMAAYFSLDSVLPKVARHVRVWTRDHYRRLTRQTNRHAG